MKINDRTNIRTTFDAINPGNCFKAVATYYIKTEQTEDDGTIYNAVNLENGTFESFDDDEVINLLHCELTVG